MSEGIKQYATLATHSKIEPIKPVNEEFTLCKVYVAATGCNRNYSYISRETMDRAMPTLAYVPVVGHLLPKYDEDGNEIGKYFGGHDYTLDENWNLKALTVPFGVVVADSFAYEQVEEYGVQQEYLTAQAILWTGRYPELKEAVYSDEVWFNQSMEVIVGQSRPYSADSNYEEFLEYSYSALCILGKSDDPEYHTEPCFISSKFVPLTYSLEREKFNADMSEMQERLAFILSPEKGGMKQMDQEKICAILAEFGLTAEAVDFDYAKMDEDALRAAAKEFAGKQNPEGAAQTPVASEFSMTYKKIYEAIQNALPDVDVRDAAGNFVSCTSYWVNDFDDQYVYVNRYVYTKDSDTSDHGRFAYTLDDSKETASITGDFELMYLMWLTGAEKEKLETSRSVFEELKQYKDENEKAKRTAAVDGLFAQFEDLQQVEGFDALRTAAYEDGSLEDVELKLYAMRGKLAKGFAKTPPKSGVKVGLTSDGGGSDNSYYGGLLTRKDN